MKNKNIIWVNCLVKNEERWIWYALQSVLSYVDRIIVWDSGSTDKTQGIIKTINSPKIEFKEIGEVNKEDYGKVRQEMLLKTKSDWVLILDGDEIWPKDSLTGLIKEINFAFKTIESFCVRPINFVGDIRYIHAETLSGQTPHGIQGLKGFFSTRVFRRDIPGLHINGPYGKESFFDSRDTTLRERTEKVKYLPKIYYWHMSYLPRSSSKSQDKEVMMRDKKRKYEIGMPRPSWIKIPEVFYLKRPFMVPDPFYKMTTGEYLKALVQTPLKRLKRRFF